MKMSNLKERIKDLSDDADVVILFKYSGDKSGPYQFDIDVLDTGYTKTYNTFFLCHEEDSDGHYAKRKK